MLTLRLDRLARLGPLCAVLTFVVPAALAVLVNANRNQDDVLGILLVAAGIIFIGSAVGSAITSGAGILLFSMGTVLAEVPVGVMAIVGAGLFATLVIHDLAGVLHRSPRVTRSVWTSSAATTTTVIVLGAAALAISYGVGKLATWQSIVVPFAIAAIGFAAKLAADSHRNAARQLTSRRPREQAPNIESSPAQ